MRPSYSGWLTPSLAKKVIRLFHSSPISETDSGRLTGLIDNNQASQNIFKSALMRSPFWTLSMRFGPSLITKFWSARCWYNWFIVHYPVLELSKMTLMWWKWLRGIIWAACMPINWKGDVSVCEMTHRWSRARTRSRNVWVFLISVQAKNVWRNPTAGVVGLPPEMVRGRATSGVKTMLM